MSAAQGSTTGYEALYWTEAEFLAKKPARKSPVVGWDESGAPLIVVREGRRVAAASLPNFHSVRLAPHIVAALPGDGWRVSWHVAPEDARPVVEPVIAWLVYSDGSTRPVADVIGGGHLPPLDLTDGDIKLIPPARDKAGVCLRCGTQCSDPFSADFVAQLGCGGAAS